MKLTPDTPPEGTIRNWLEARAGAGGVAVVFPETGEELTWEGLLDDARRVACVLTAKGAKRGESVAIVSPNGPDALKAFFGVVYGGFRATMINLAAGRDAISYALEHSEAQFSYVHQNCKALFDEANLTGVETLSLEDDAEAQLFELSPDHHALLMYTSGTTGRPKGVVHTHASLLAGGWTTAIAHELSESDRGFCVLPIYHINGLCVTVMGSLVSGGSLSMVGKFSTSRFWQQAEDSKVTWFSVVPTIISHLLHGNAEPSGDCKARMRFGRSASSALAVETQSGFEGRFEVPIIETMGLTETAAQILSNPLPPKVRRIGSPGLAYGCDVEVHDSNGRPVATDSEGEIVVRGPNVMLEYLKNPEATQATFRNGWLRTGDLAKANAEGFIFVTGRLKELIIKGGENIAPREVDEALYAHPDVVEAAAFGRPCTSYGEKVEAAVRLREGSSVDARILIELCIGKLGAFKAPETIHILDELPKGPSGKIQRLKLSSLV